MLRGATPLPCSDVPCARDHACTEASARIVERALDTPPFGIVVPERAHATGLAKSFRAHADEPHRVTAMHMLKQSLGVLSHALPHRGGLTERL